MPGNKNAGYGAAQLDDRLASTGKTFVVVGTSGASYQDMIALWSPDSDGVPRSFTTVTLALAQCVTGRGDVIMLAPDFTTAFTAAEILSAETKGVTVVNAGLQNVAGAYFCERATATLPQSLPTSGAAIFTVTGKIKLLSIQGVVTTQIQTQTTNARLVALTSIGVVTTQSDLCISADISAVSVGAVLVPLSVYTSFGVSLTNNVTGWSPTALGVNSSAAFLYQIAPVVVQQGTINLCTGASSTGSIKWRIEYIPMEPGARVFAA